MFLHFTIEKIKNISINNINKSSSNHLLLSTLPALSYFTLEILQKSRSCSYGSLNAGNSKQT